MYYYKYTTKECGNTRLKELIYNTKITSSYLAVVKTSLIQGVMLAVMNILERIISVPAPHQCLSCLAEGSLLCEACRLSLVTPLPDRCYGCGKASRQSATCKSCKRQSPLSHVWVATAYEGAPKDLVYKLKFGRANGAAGPLANILADRLPLLESDILVTYVPTANARVRKRGYDQSRLIAKELAFARGWLCLPLLARLGSGRQVGASREKRLIQLQEAFLPQKVKYIKDAHILLVDDVITTGATLEATAKQLKKAGAKQVDAVVFAQS